MLNALKRQSSGASASVSAHPPIPPRHSRKSKPCRPSAKPREIAWRCRTLTPSAWRMSNGRSSEKSGGCTTPQRLMLLRRCDRPQSGWENCNSASPRLARK